MSKNLPEWGSSVSKEKPSKLPSFPGGPAVVLVPPGTHVGPGPQPELERKGSIAWISVYSAPAGFSTDGSQLRRNSQE